MSELAFRIPSQSGMQLFLGFMAALVCMHILMTDSHGVNSPDGVSVLRVQRSWLNMPTHLSHLSSWTHSFEVAFPGSDEYKDSVRQTKPAYPPKS